MLKSTPLSRITLEGALCVRAEVLFGNPTKNCEGHGICRIVPFGSLNFNECKCAYTSVWIYNSENGKIRLSFDLSGLSNRLKEKMFVATKFRVEARFSLPQFVLDALGFKTEYIVEERDYLYVRGRETVTIIF